MTWFERITGFSESGYEATRAKLTVRDGQLYVPHTGMSWGVGVLSTPSLAQLREQMAKQPPKPGQLNVQENFADVRDMHSQAEAKGAVFQVASQFNLLEMVSPDMTPEHGVTRYEDDLTQGPACAIAAGAGTIYRNYLMPLREGTGQTSIRQLDCLGDLGQALGNHTGALWEMRNGYAMASLKGLEQISEKLSLLDAAGRDGLRALLRIGVHWDVEVTDPMAGRGQHVTQVYCSALPLAYSRVSPRAWEPLARLVLEAAYEATLLVAALNSVKTGCRLVFLTRLGGGAFGNPGPWIDDALARALALASRWDMQAISLKRG